MGRWLRHPFYRSWCPGESIRRQLRPSDPEQAPHDHHIKHGTCSPLIYYPGRSEFVSTNVWQAKPTNCVRCRDFTPMTKARSVPEPMPREALGYHFQSERQKGCVPTEERSAAMLACGHMSPCQQPRPRRFNLCGLGILQLASLRHRVSTIRAGTELAHTGLS